MKMYIASDGWPFYQQKDGTLTDTPNARDCDLSYDSLDQLLSFDEDTREATLDERKRWAKVRYEHNNSFGKVK